MLLSKGPIMFSRWGWQMFLSSNTFHFLNCPLSARCFVVNITDDTQIYRFPSFLTPPFYHLVPQPGLENTSTSTFKENADISSNRHCSCFSWRAFLLKPDSLTQCALTLKMLRHGDSVMTFLRQLKGQKRIFCKVTTDWWRKWTNHIFEMSRAPSKGQPQWKGAFFFTSSVPF